MNAIDGFTDLKPPHDYADPNWTADIYLPDDGDRRSFAVWFLALGAIQMLIGIAIGFWMGSAS